MRLTALLFLAALLWALICGSAPEAALAAGSGKEPHKALAAKKENVKQPGLASKTLLKPSSSRRFSFLECILEKVQEGAEMIKEVKDSALQTIEALKHEVEDTIHDVRDKLERGLHM